MTHNAEQRANVNGSSQTSGGEATTRGEAGHIASPPDAHGTSTGEKRHRKAGEPLCDACRKWRRDYDREYSRLRRMNPDRRAKQSEIFANWRRRNMEHRNAYARQRARELRQRAEHDRRHELDPVVVERLIHGEPTPANRLEKTEALRQILARGYNLTEAARRLGLNYDYARKYAQEIERGNVA